MSRFSFISMIKFSLFLALLCGVCSGSRILVFYPGVSGSLLLSFNPLFRELVRRGHEVTVVTKHPLPGVQEHNITQIVIERDDNPEVIENFKRLSVVRQIIYEWQLFAYDCEMLFKIPKIMAIVNSDKKYDLFIGSPYYFLECSIAVAHHLNLPVLNIYSNRFSIHASHSVGHPQLYPYISELHLPFGDDMNLWQRTVNTVFNLGYSLGLSVYYIPRMAAVVEKHFPLLPPLQEMLSHVPVTLMNTNLAIHSARPLLPGVIPVGGLTISLATKLQQDLQEWMDSSDQGVILFSLGSNIKMTSIDPEILKVILKVFEELPQRVLMKWEEDTLVGKPHNVRVAKWIPQAAALAHRNCRLFMTHGGLHSWEEAVYYGVPLLGLLPIFFDQVHNLAEMQGRGQGLYFKGPWTEENLRLTIEEILKNPKFKENLQKASQVFIDLPLKPLDHAVFWTEYVIRHGGAKHLQSPVSTMPWYQVASLDVISLLVIFVSISVLICWAVLQWLRKLLINCKHIVFNYSLKLFTKLKLH